MTIYSNPTLQWMRLAALHKMACGEFAMTGELNVGLLLDRIWTATQSGTFLGEDGVLFAGTSREELDALYEPELNHMERDLGPFVCIDRGSWWYAVSPHWPHRGQGRTLSPALNLELWKQRALVLEKGHPDQLRWKQGQVPKSRWRRARTTKHEPR